MALHNIETPKDIRDFIVNTLKEIQKISPDFSAYNQSKWQTAVGVDEDHPCGTTCCIMGWRWNFDHKKLSKHRIQRSPLFVGEYSMNHDTPWISGKFRKDLVELLELTHLYDVVDEYNRRFHGTKELRNELNKMGFII